MNTKTITLLCVPDLAAALASIVGPVTLQELWMWIGDGTIKPHGYVVRAPVFHPGQVGTIAKIIRRKRKEVRDVHSRK